LSFVESLTPADPNQPRVFVAPLVARVTQGPGCTRGLLGAVERAGAGRALVITGTSIAERTGMLWYVEQVLGYFHAGSYTGVQAHVPEATVAEAVELAAAAAAGLLVSLGGGSAIDTAKAVAHELAATRGVAPAHIAVPTTLSAAEFTPYAGVTGRDQVKRRISGDQLAPREVFLDPEMTLATPTELWLSSGIKALDHAIESMLSPRHHPITDTLALEAVRRLFASLPACAGDPTAIEPRGDAQVAAWMSLFSAGTSRGGLSHAIGHQLGARGVPHGITSCITLPAVLRFLAGATGDRQRAIAASLGAGTTLERAVADLIERLALPTRLRDTGLARDTVPSIAAAVWPEVRAVSPGPIDDERVLIGLLEEMW
jgi:alcohol dehydrogenase class IV